TYRFEDYSLDPDRRELRRGAQVIAVEPLVFDLLEYLVRNRERVITKDDLIEAVWHGRIVSDSAIASRINAARQAVGDAGNQQRLSRTGGRQGVRFGGEVGLEGSGSATRHPAASGQHQDVRQGDRPNTPGVTFRRTPTGVNLAVASVGQGPVVVRTAHWF